MGDWRREEWRELFCTLLLNAREGVMCVCLEICWVATVVPVRDTILMFGGI